MKQTNYTPSWNLTTIPDDQFFSEYGRRRSHLRRKFTGGSNGGRAKVPTPCPRCDEMCESWRAAQRHQCATNQVDSIDPVEAIEAVFEPIEAGRTLTLTIKIGDGPIHDIQVPVSIEAIEAAMRGEVITVLPGNVEPITLVGWNLAGRVE